jgi:hypothetical protein
MKTFVLMFTGWHQCSQLHTVRVTKWHTLFYGEGDWELSEEEEGSLTSFACPHTSPQFHDCLHLMLKFQATNHAMVNITEMTMSFVTWGSFFRAEPGRMGFLLCLQNNGQLMIISFQILEPGEFYSPSYCALSVQLHGLLPHHSTTDQQTFLRLSPAINTMTFIYFEGSWLTQ